MVSITSLVGLTFPDSALASASAPPWWVPAITTAVLTSLGAIAATLATVSASARRAVALELRKQQLDIEKQRSDVSFRRQVEWCEGAISEATALLDAAVAFRTAVLHVPTTGEQAEAMIARAQSFDAALRVLRARTTTALIYVPPEAFAQLSATVSLALNSPDLHSADEFPRVAEHLADVRTATLVGIGALVFHVRALLGQPPLDTAGRKVLDSIAPAPPSPNPPSGSDAPRA